MAVKSSHRIESINLQEVASDFRSPSPSLQYLKPPPAKSHWKAAKKALHSSRGNNFVARKVPEYCPSHTPLHSSFSSEESLALLLSEIQQRDTELQACLDAKKRKGGGNISKDSAGESIDIEAEERDKFDEQTDPGPKQIPEDLKHFQDLVNLFLSLFLQSEFSRRVLGKCNQSDPKETIRWLANTQSCPNVTLFRRVVVDPNLIAGEVPEIDNLGYAGNGVSVNQLARFLDVAVLQFLSTVNEHTEPHAVLWALNYLTSLLQSLISSMNTLNSFGWYGAPHIRIRKGTTVGRKSISYPLQPPTILNPPPVVVVPGTPPNSPQSNPGINVLNSVSIEETRDPVTGQRSPVLSPLVQHNVASELAGQDSNSFSTAGAVRPSVELSCNRDEITTTTTAEVGPLPPLSREAAPAAACVSIRANKNGRQESKATVKVSPFAPSSPVSIGNRGYGSSTSDEGPHNHPLQQPLHGILKTPFTTESAISPSRSPPKSVVASSPPSNTMGAGSGGRKRKVTPAGPPSGFVPVLKFDSTVDESHVMGAGSVRRRKLTPAAPPPGFVPVRSGLSISLPRRSRSRQGTDNMISIIEEKETDSVRVDDLESAQEEVDSPVDEVRTQIPSALETYNPLEKEISSPLGREVTSPLCLSLRASVSEDTIQPQASPTSPNLTPTQDHTQSHTHVGSVSSISSPLPSRRASLVHNPFGDDSDSITLPPVPKDLPNVDVAHELSTFTNGEGRISLLAILHAITKLPECKAVWSEEVGEKCFSLIQHCIDIGVPQKEDTQQSGNAKFKSSILLQERKKRLTRQDNVMDKDRKSEKPWTVHGRHIVEFSVKSLIQCSTCSLVGCSTDANSCRLRQYNVSSSFQKSSIHNKLIRNLKRINLHSPTVFRKVVGDFAHPSMSSCRKLFHFLHVVLQYCSHGQDVHFNPLLDSVVVSTLSIVVDRLTSLDISEISIQESIIREACDFISYANHLFHQDMEVKSRVHLHMYIHRIALSVMLPPRPTLELTEAISPFHATSFSAFIMGEGGGVDCSDSSGSFGRLPAHSTPNKKLVKQKTHVPAIASFHEARNTSMPLASFSTSTLMSDAHSPSKPGLARNEKPPMIKQHSVLLSRMSEKSLFSNSSLPRERKSGRTRGGREGTREEVKVQPVLEWKGLKLKVLRTRVQRLSVLLEMSEPGTIPDAGMLASLVDLCDGTTVVARSMVFLECAMFVRKLSSHNYNISANTWICHNSENPRMQHVTSNLHKWAEAIGERLRLAELKEKEMYKRLKQASVHTKGPNTLPEEPVFPDDYNKDVELNRGSSEADAGGSDSDSGLHIPNIGYTISYALKMSACNLLLEITRFIRDIPAHFIPSLSQAGTPLISGAMLNFDRFSDQSRKYSNTSVASSENDFISHCLAPRSQEARMSNYGSSLSVEDADDYLRGSLDESNVTAALNNSPRKSRTSIYLHINPSFNKSNLSRNVSSKRQSRMVLVSEGADLKSSAKPFSVMRSRSHRCSISSSNMQHINVQHDSNFAGGLLARRTSQYGNTYLSSSQPNHPGGFPNLGGSYLLKDRRKSMGAAMTHSMSHSSEMSDCVPPHTPSTSHTPQFKYGGGGAGTFLGTSLNIGFTKLKRSAQRAFRRHGPKFRYNDPTSPGSSPGTVHRSKSRKTSTSESYSHRSSFISQPEESRGKYPWLDVVEHLVLMDATNADNNQRHKQSCLELTVALKKVYSGAFHGAFEEEEEEEAEGRGGKERAGGKALYARRVSKGMKRNSSLGTIFIHPFVVSDGYAYSDHRGSSITTVPYSKWNSLPNSPDSTSACIVEKTVRSISLNYPHKMSTDFSSLGIENQRKSLSKKVSVMDLTYMKYLMGEAVLPGSNRTSEETVRLAIEAASPFEKSYVLTQTDKEYCSYIDNRVSGLMHVPFSTLIHAAPVLYSRTFTSLKGMAWEVLLSSDCELSQAAGVFFLLASAKEHEMGMKGFVKASILNQASVEKRSNAILKFKVLWDCRYGVWPRMEGRCQKKFNSDKEDKEKKEQTIGYSQLANPLGHQGEDLPLSPSDPVSVCTSRICADNPDKCYRPTKMAPVIHPKEISVRVHAFHVSGVSVTQEVGGTKSNSVIYKVDSDDVAGVREWEVVDSTLFPHSLLPLIKFVISALVPANINPSPSSSSSSPLASFSSVDSVNTPQEQLEGSELARQVVWACMVEDPRLFFRSLLNRFNKLYMMISDKKTKRSNFEYLIADTLEPFHIVLQSFPKLPPRAAHMLLNNFVGVIIQHTDQPYRLSAKVIQSVLTLISMVTCSVQGLDSKLLKCYLKKESCYTSMMASARIRGVERVVLVTDPNRPGRTYKVTDDMTFGHLMDVCQTDHSTQSQLNDWYLLDESKDLPVLSAMFIQDHYSAPSDKTKHPTFILRKMSNPTENVCGNQMDQLFVFKMSEVMRVLFNTQLLSTGPEVEKGHAYSEYAVPNYQFIHNELVELNSFPRKALTSVQYEVGPNVLYFQLRASDIMLKGMWVRFVMQLMVASSKDYDWSNSMVLFMNVVNGSLLLHSEDYTILYYSLATILIAATKFNSVFKKDGYQMIVPALIHVYHLHMKNKVITDAIKFVWIKFYILNGNNFISQVMAAASTLLSEEASSLSNSINSNLIVMPNLSSWSSMEIEEAKKLIAKALFELNGSLVDDKHRVKDELNILHCCFHHLDPDLYALLTPDSLQYISVKETALLAIVLAGWNPEAIRGMQVLVFLDHMMPFFLPSLGYQERKFTTDAMQYLIKKCESISKPTQTWLGGDILPSRTKKTGKKESVSKILKQGQSFADDDVIEPPRSQVTRKSSMARVMNKILYNPNKKEIVSANFTEDDGANGGNGKQGEGCALGIGQEGTQIDRATYQNQFRLRGLQNTNHKILQMSRNALLSVISEFSGYYSKGCVVGVGGFGSVFSPRKFSAQVMRKVSTLRACIEASEPPTKLNLDPNSVLVVVNISCQMLKQGTHSEVFLQSRGLNSFFAHFLISLDWNENHFSAFNTLLYRLVRLFKQMQRDSNKAIMVWDHLTNFILGLTLCIHHNPQLVLGQDQILTRLKALLETVMVMQGSRGEQPPISALHRKLRSMHPSLLESAPSLFAESAIELAVELIMITNSSQNNQRMQSKFRYHITDLILQKSLKDHEDFLMPKIILPLCIQLGLRADCYSISVEDIDFFMMFIDSKVDVAHKFKLSAELIFQVLKVFCCAFSEALSLHQWNRVAQWIMALFNRKLSLPLGNTRTSTTSISNEGIGEKTARKQSNILSSSSPLESFVSFHENLLSFFETFLVVCRVPLLSLLQPILWEMEPRLEVAKQGVKVDNPGHLEKLSGCIERCQQMKKASQRIIHFKARQQLLQEMQEELKWISQSSGRVNRSYTTTEGNQQPKKRSLRMRRNSESLGKIKEESDVEGMLTSSFSLPRVSSRKVTDKRPTTLILNQKSVGIKDTSSSFANPNDDKRARSPSIKLNTAGSSTSKSILSSSTREGVRMRKRSPEIRSRTRFMDSINSLEEEDECFLASSISDSEGRERFLKHLSSPKRGRSPKLSRRGSEEVMSVEYLADVEEEDLFKPRHTVIENFLTASPTARPHPHSYSRVTEENYLQENANATSLPPKKKVAFKKRSGSKSPSPHCHTVQVEMHYDNKEENEDERKEAEWKDLEETIGDDSLKSLGSPLLHTKETEMSRPDAFDATSNTHVLYSNEISRGHLGEKSNSISGGVGGSAKQALTQIMKRPKSPNISAINKLSISQPCILSDDTNQFLDIHDSANRNSLYHMQEGITYGDNGMLVKSHSVDHANKLTVESNSMYSDDASSSLKKRKAPFLYKGQQSNSEMTAEDFDAGRNLL